jgi:hypothetical protein
MSTQELPRWLEVSDGTLSVKATIIDALNFTHTYESIGGYSTLRMMNGTALKQQNWQKLKVSISGNGGLPFGLNGLDYSKLITLKCGAPRAIVRPTNSFTLPSARRTDTGYEPVTFKLVEGFWIPLAAAGTATAYKQLYYPQISCFMDPPQESFFWEGSPPTSWSLTAEEA